MKKILLLFFSFSLLLVVKSYSQGTAFLVTDPVVEQVMLGNYDPLTYTATIVLNHPDSISQGILQSVNADSLKNNILKLASFQNRNTGSDT